MADTDDNPFLRHGIDHLSASAIHSFARSNAGFVMERLLKRRLPGSAAMSRGTAAESGIVHGLLDHSRSLDECIALALAEFDRITPGARLGMILDEKAQKERGLLPGLVQHGIAELRPYGVPSGVQVRLEKWLPGVPVPFLCFLDLHYDHYSNHAPVTVDIKTAARIPTEISEDHARQVALYVHGTNHEGRVCYVTPKAAETKPVVDAAARAAECVNIATRLGNFLRAGSAEVLAGMVCPDTSHAYLYKDPAARALVREIFGL